MIFTILLGLLLVLIKKGKLMDRIIFTLFFTIIHVVLTVFVARNLGITELKNNFFSFHHFSIPFSLVQIFVAIILLIAYYFIMNLLTEKTINSFFKPMYLFFFVLLGLLIFLGSLALNSAKWAMNFFGNIGIDEILYTLSQPLTGTDAGQIHTFILGPFLNSVVFTISVVTVFFLCLILFSKEQIVYLTKKNISLLTSISIILFVSGISIGIHIIGYADLRAYFFEKSTLYEEYFVDPNDVMISFPSEKRNLIYIYVESLESTFLSTELGGFQSENLLPNLSQIAYSDGINFSHQQALGGALQVPGVGFTVGGMVAQSAGVPLKVMGGYNANEYGNTTTFMPGITSIGTILEKQGYTNTILMGSDAEFGGRNKFFEQHGDYEIRDYYYAIEKGWIPNDYKVWWGYEDEKLFEFAKQTLDELSVSSEPFNFTFLTADMHFPDGFKTENTPNLFNDQYSNVIHYSDQMIGEFIRWIQQQPYYENTTIVLSGDHLSMDSNFFQSLEENYQRTVFNLIINAPISTNRNTQRQYNTMDMFPTTLATLDITIEGNRLGLGTNLFSERETLMEELGSNVFTTELSKNSSFYNTVIMQGSDFEIKNSQ